MKKKTVHIILSIIFLVIIIVLVYQILKIKDLKLKYSMNEQGGKEVKVSQEENKVTSQMVISSVSPSPSGTPLSARESQKEVEKINVKEETMEDILMLV